MIRGNKCQHCGNWYPDFYDHCPCTEEEEVNEELEDPPYIG